MKIHCTYDKLIEIKDLRPNPKNRNVHPADQIDRLAKILDHQGWRYPIVVSNQSGFIVTGHGRLAAAIKNSWKEVPVNYQDFASEEDEYAHLIADNGIASWAELDLSAINVDIGDLGPDFDIDMLGLKDFTIDVADKFESDPDEAPEPPKEAKSKRGELWLLGNHRLLIDDCTVKDNVERLMNGEKADTVFTDPPYGMNLDTDWSDRADRGNHTKLGRTGRKYAPVQGDQIDFDPAHIFEKFDCDEIFLWGADYYCQRLPSDGGWLVWDKRTRADGEAIKQMVGSEFELCWSKQKHARQIARILWSGLCQGPKEGKRVHPTQKPAALAEWFFERWGKDANLIWDGYLGSGSTLIACEKTNRKCYGMEIDPIYGDVILSRWAKFTGKDPEREDGVKWSNLNG
jgi:DNA modification methylase